MASGTIAALSLLQLRTIVSSEQLFEVARDHLTAISVRNDVTSVRSECCDEMARGMFRRCNMAPNIDSAARHHGINVLAVDQRWPKFGRPRPLAALEVMSRHARREEDCDADPLICEFHAQGLGVSGNCIFARRVGRHPDPWRVGCTG